MCKKYKKAAVTDRRLCPDLLPRIETLDSSDFDYIILREKDLPRCEYLALAHEAVKRSRKIILHTYIDVCETLNYRRVHLPFKIFRENVGRLRGYELLGISVHSVEEAVLAAKAGADYITASHIFPTVCKSGLPPKGIDWLSEVCRAVNGTASGTEVYALGGIHEDNIKMCIAAGADGICMMSEAMRDT